MGINNVGYSIKRKNRLAAFLFIMGAILIFLFCLRRTFLPLIIQVDKVPSSIDGVAIDIAVKWLLIGLSFFLVTAGEY